MRKRQAATEGLVVETNGPARRWALLLLFALFALAALWPGGTHKAVAQTPPPTSAITIVAHDLATNAVLPEFTFLVNVDNAHLGDDPDPMQRPGVAPTESNSPVVALGDQDSATVSLPDGRYLISDPLARPQDVGQAHHARRPTPAPSTSRCADTRRKGRLPARQDPRLRLRGHELGQLGARRDRAGARGLPHHDRRADRPARHRRLLQQPALRRRLRHRRRRLRAARQPRPGDVLRLRDPAGHRVQRQPRQPVGPDLHLRRRLQRPGRRRGGERRHRAPGEQLWEPPNVRTGNWFGFACFPTDFADPGTGEITGRALNWVGWPPFDALVTDPNEPVQNPYIALSDSTTDVTVYVGQGDGAGSFDIQNVPAGTYNMAIWDEQLSYIIRFLTVTVADGEVVDRSATSASRAGSAGSRATSTSTRTGTRSARRTSRGSRHRRRPALARRVGQGRHPYRLERALRVPDGRGRPARQVDHRRAGLRSPGRDRRDRLRREHRRALAGPDALGGALLDEPAPQRGAPGRRRLGQAGLRGRRARARSSASPSGERRGTRWTRACRRPRATSRRSPT